MDQIKIVKDITRVEFEVKKDRFFKATRICFKQKLPRSERDKIGVKFKENKFKTIWGENTCLVVK